MAPSFERWVGKVAIVTGASAGIGYSLVEHLVEKGLIVAGLARRSEKVEELSKKLSNKKGKLHAVKCDVANEDDILKAFDWVKNNLGPISILINNAGIVRPSMIKDGKTQEWRDVLNTNVIGLSICCREAIKNMIKNNIDGHIININSGLGYQVHRPGLNMYPPSKFAVRALSETLRQEFNVDNLKIKVTNLSPGITKSDFGQDSNAPIPDIYKLNPYLLCEDVSNAVLYVLSTPPHVQIHELRISALKFVDEV